MKVFGNGRKNRTFMLGERYGRWTVIEEPPGDYCLVRCDCGWIKEVRRGNLLNGQSRSCGCLLMEVVRGRSNAKRKGTRHA